MERSGLRSLEYLSPSQTASAKVSLLERILLERILLERKVQKDMV